MEETGLEFTLQFERLVLTARVIDDFAKDVELAITKHDEELLKIAVGGLRECTPANLALLTELRNIVRSTLSPELMAEFDKKAAEINAPYEMNEEFFKAVRRHGMGNA